MCMKVFDNLIWTGNNPPLIEELVRNGGLTPVHVES